MKKMVAVILVAVMLYSVAFARADGRVDYSPENPVTYVVCAWDEETETCYTAFVDLYDLWMLSMMDAVFSAYAIDTDGLYEVSWHWSERLSLFVVTDCHGCEVEYFYID